MPAAAYRYNAFGLFIHSGIIHSPWLFSSQRYDHATSFYHFDKREYDPNIGRWLTPDPLGFSDGPNLYAYVHNNPLIYVDPYGLFWAEAGEFGHGFTRGFFDDTTYGGSSYLCGNYHSPSTLGNWGYNFGTGTSMAAGLLYGGAEVRLLKGAATGVFLGANKIRQSWFACNQATTTAKALHETHQVAKLASDVSAPTILKVSQAAERNTIGKGWIAEVAKKAGRNRFVPDSNAKGAHTVFRRDFITGKTTHYETYRPQTNPFDPKPWESVKRFDGQFHHPHKHYNKISKQDVPTPHVHDPFIPGEIRPAELWEIP